LSHLPDLAHLSRLNPLTPDRETAPLVSAATRENCVTKKRGKQHRGSFRFERLAATPASQAVTPARGSFRFERLAATPTRGSFRVERLAATPPRLAATPA
jgi:hypothetical protein